MTDANHTIPQGHVGLVVQHDDDGDFVDATRCNMREEGQITTEAPGGLRAVVQMGCHCLLVG